MAGVVVAIAVRICGPGAAVAASQFHRNVSAGATRAEAHPVQEEPDPRDLAVV